jgi:hypothetical protein
MSVADLATTIRHLIEASGTSLRMHARRKISEACAAMIHVQSVNTSKICDALPDAPKNVHEREQWLFRLLSNESFDEADAIGSFACAELALASQNGQRPVLCMDQTELGDKHAILMLALRVGERAVPLAWHVEKGEANIGSAEQIKLLETVSSWLPLGAKPILMGDRFYPSVALFSWLRAHEFSWRIRLKSTTELSCSNGAVGSVGDLAAIYKHKDFFDSEAAIFSAASPTGIGWIWDKGHAEGWAVAMDCKATRASTLDYGCRWSIEPMFSDFKSRGFDLQSSQMRLPERLSKMVMLVAVAMRVCMAAGDEAVKKTLAEAPTTSSAVAG